MKTATAEVPSNFHLMKTSQLHTLIKELGGKETKSRNKPFLMRVAARLAEARAKPVKPDPPEAAPKKKGREFKHDPRVGPVGTVYERAHDGVIHKIQVHERGFLWLNHREKGIFRSSSKIAKEITGTGWFGLVFFRIVPYNRREARGVGLEKIDAAYQEAVAAFNRVSPEAKLPKSLEAVLSLADSAAARQEGKAMHAAAERLRQLATALSVAANRVEVRHGREKGSV